MSLAAALLSFPPLLGTRPPTTAVGASCLQYVLPTDAPHLGDAGTRLRTVMTPLLWSQHKPDCFDTYSAGVVLMQLRWAGSGAGWLVGGWRGC